VSYLDCVFSAPPLALSRRTRQHYLARGRTALENKKLPHSTHLLSTASRAFPTMFPRAGSSH